MEQFHEHTIFRRTKGKRIWEPKKHPTDQSSKDGRTIILLVKGKGASYLQGTRHEETGIGTVDIGEQGRAANIEWEKRVI